MALTRRRFLTHSSLAVATGLLTACTHNMHELVVGPQQIGSWPTARDSYWQALNRMTFGPRPNERARVAEIGLDAWIEEQLSMDGDDLNDLDATLRVRRLDTLNMDTSILFDVREDNVRRELQQATLLRAVYSRQQLYEVMVEFWSDHFNISTLKQYCGWLKTIDDRDVIRPHALGNFGDLLWASMHSPAMLIYLDNQENHASHPNENYARELMELHTLGVDAGYTQQDVQEVARCLTGWTVYKRLFRGQFQFQAQQHDNDQKVVLGTVIPAGGGKQDGAQVFELLMNHPATPSFIAAKLVRRLVADAPPAALVEAVANTFRKTRGDIRAMLRTILYSEAFRTAPPKIKRPFHYVAGALRQLNAETDGGKVVLEALTRMGQPLFQWATPDGYPEETTAWSGNLLPRWQFAYNLLADKLPHTSLDLEALVQAAGVATMSDALEQFSTLLLGAPLPAAQHQALLQMLGLEFDLDRCTLAIATLLASPAYQWR